MLYAVHVSMRLEDAIEIHSIDSSGDRDRSCLRKARKRGRVRVRTGRYKNSKRNMGLEWVSTEDVWPQIVLLKGWVKCRRQIPETETPTTRVQLFPTPSPNVDTIHRAAVGRGRLGLQDRHQTRRGFVQADLVVVDLDTEHIIGRCPTAKGADLEGPGDGTDQSWTAIPRSKVTFIRMLFE